MCGIVAVVRKDGKPAYKSVLKRYRAQKHRGTDGYGYVAIIDEKVVSYQRATTEHEIVKLLAKETASEIWFHHRNPTSTPNVEEEAHPILTEHKSLKHQYLVMHNGVIRNDRELKKKHEKMGIKYTTELMRGFLAVATGKQYKMEMDWNDSESLAVEIALTLDGKQTRMESEGPAAVVGIQTKGVDVVNRFFFRNYSNPLKYHEDRDMITITSSGAGEDVSPLNVMRLKKGGGFEKFDNISPPNAFKEYKGTPYTPPINGVRNLLPDRTASSVGFVPPFSDAERRRFEEQDDINFGDDPLNFDLTEESSYTPPSILSVAEVLASIGLNWFPQHISKERNPLIKTFAVDTLWDEYDKTLGAEIEIKKAIAMVDEAMLTDDADGEIYDQRVDLQDKLDRVVKYQSELDSEIMRRTNLESSLSK